MRVVKAFPKGQKIAFYLSEDGEAKGLLLTTEVLQSPLKPGKSSQVRFSKRLNSPVNCRYVLAVIDPEKKIPEAREDNNCAAVAVPGRNAVPVANAGPDQTVRVMDTVYLDGSKSSDADRSVLQFEWQFESMPQGSKAELKDSQSVFPSFVVDIPGSYVLRLGVTDGCFKSLPDRVTITTENSKPVANAGPDKTAALGSMVQLDGSKSSDVDGDALTYF